MDSCRVKTIRPVDDAFLHALPKAELHIHLTGTVRPETFVELARRYDVPLRPFQEPAELYTFKGETFAEHLADFLAVYDAVGQCLRTRADFHRVTCEALEDLSRSGVRYLEMFFSPQAPMLAGARYPEILEGICSGLRDGERDFKIIGRLIPAHNRELGLACGLEFLDLVLAHRKDDIIGIGLDFSEVKSPPALFPELFRRAREAGLHRTAHAGEEGPGSHVRDSLALLDCERIDHGYRVSEDPEAVHLARERGTCFTVCPSLVRSFFGDFPPAQDPIQRMDDLGLSYVIASDDPSMLHSNLLHEYRSIGHKLGFSREKFKDLALNGLRASWLDETTRSVWLGDWSREIDSII